MGSADLGRVTSVASAAHNLAVVATTRPDGSVHASVVSAGVMDDPVSGEPSVALVAVGGSRKLEHFRRVGRACAVFQNGGDWVAAEGPVRIAGPDDPCEGIDAAEIPALLRAVFVAAGGTHDDWDEYDRVMAEQHRTAVFITPQRIWTNG